MAAVKETAIRLITGATGIAAATARIAAARGAAIYLAGIEEEDCRSTAAHWQSS